MAENILQLMGKFVRLYERISFRSNVYITYPYRALSPFSDKNKRFAEQASASVCLRHLGLWSFEILGATWLIVCENCKYVKILKIRSSNVVVIFLISDVLSVL